MSFARFAEDCHVYVFDHVDLGLVCWNCGVPAMNVAFGPNGHEGLLNHLDEHRAAGDRVPEYVIEQISDDAATSRRNRQWPCGPTAT